MANPNFTLNVDTTAFHKELDVLAARVKKIKGEMQDSGIVPAFFGFFGGRCTTFAIAFFVIGVFLEMRGHLSAQFVALAGIIQALILAHSAKEDYHERNAVATTVNVAVEEKK